LSFYNSIKEKKNKEENLFSSTCFSTTFLLEQSPFGILRIIVRRMYSPKDYFYSPFTQN